jgi:hypothetical protein
MMWLDPFNLLLSFVVFMVYGPVCVVMIIFTFFLDIYLKIDEKLKLDFLITPVLTPLEANIQWVDSWLMSHNKIVGPTLILLSLIDLKLLFDIIYKL